MHTTSVRMFKIVIQIKGKPVSYPDADGEKSLKLMEKLSKSALTPVAHTTANGIDEVLTLEEMRDIYSD
jgi:hypothetical protein